MSLNNTSIYPALHPYTYNIGELIENQEPTINESALQLFEAL